MECPASPSKEVLLRSQRHFQETLSTAILQQERLHAASKKPRRTRFAQEADYRIHTITAAVQKIAKRVLVIQGDFKNLATRVNRLDVIREQACFFMSPKRVLSSATAMRSPVKLTYSPGDVCNGYVSPMPCKLVEFVRRRKVAGIHLSKVCSRLNAEKKLLQDIFESNIAVLRFKRAEKCLIKMITLQSRLKGLGKEFESLEERLFEGSNNNSSNEEDSGYNESGLSVIEQETD